MAFSPRQAALTALFSLASLTSYLVLKLLLTNLDPTIPFLTPTPPPTPAEYKGYSSLYSFDLSLAHFPTWMANLPDTANLTSLSIPGTHDTMTHLVTSPVFQCQNLDLPTQLDAGLRYFDIRARLLANETEPVLGIYHGSVATGYTLADVLLALFAFLDAHPGEGVIMRLKEEGPPVGTRPADPHAPGANRTFEDAFNHYRLADARTAAGCARHLLHHDPQDDPPPPASPALPTMGELRGRILVLQEFESASGAAYGLPWGSPHIALEDLWIIPTLGHLEDKWGAIRANLEAAASSGSGGDVLYLSHLSASVGVLPIEAAAGPPSNLSIVGMNDRTGRWLVGGQGSGAGGKTGVVMADFPGRRLVEAILQRNNGLFETGRI